LSRQSAARLVPLALAVLAAAACARTQGATDARPRAASIRVRTAPVVSKDVVYGISALGSLEAQELVQVTAEVEGAVSQVLFHEGDRVTPQTVLLRIDPDRYRLEAERAEANYRKAVADAARARQDLERREQLAREQLVPAEELNRSRSETEGLDAEAAAK
jgi:multidrug efflux pump subunit AcrA (membrane-fusion protein)